MSHHSSNHNNLVIPLLALSAGISVANIYLNQPLLETIAQTFTATSNYVSA
jgi:NTP-dependent ternary system trypsin peptidase co-occuring protein